MCLRKSELFHSLGYKLRAKVANNSLRWDQVIIGSAKSMVCILAEKLNRAHGKVEEAGFYHPFSNAWTLEQCEPV